MAVSQNLTVCLARDSGFARNCVTVWCSVRGMWPEHWCSGQIPPVEHHIVVRLSMYPCHHVKLLHQLVLCSWVFPALPPKLERNEFAKTLLLNLRFALRVLSSRIWGVVRILS